MKGIAKRVATIFLALAVIFTCMPFIGDVTGGAAGAPKVYAGDSYEQPVGENIHADYTGTELILRGTGSMYNCAQGDSVPWEADKNDYTTVWIEDGITSIGAYVFSDMENLEEIWIPASVTSIDPNALRILPDLETVYYGGKWATLQALCNALGKNSPARKCLEMADWACLDAGSSEYRLVLDDVDANGMPCKTIEKYSVNKAIDAVLMYLVGIDIDPISGTEYNVDFGEDGIYDLNVKLAYPNEYYSVTYTALDGGRGEVFNEPIGSYVNQNLYNNKCFFNQFTVWIPVTMTDEAVKLNKTSFAYTGSAIKPSVTVTMNGIAMKAGTDYKVSYSNNTNAGTGKVTVTGFGYNEGSVTKTFTITPKSLSSIHVELDVLTYLYDGTAKKPPVVAKDGSKKLTLNKDYKVSYTNNTKVGTATATITGMGNYTGQVTKTFTIKKGNATVGSTTIRNTIANSAKKTNDVIWDKTAGATGYELQWRKKGAGTWSSVTVGNTVRGKTTGLTIKGLYEIRVRPIKAATANYNKAEGKWSPTVYRYFFTVQTIRLKSASKGSFTMSWAKDPDATSYQVMFTTNANGAGAAKNIRTTTGTSLTVSGLKSGQTYYVQVRAIKKVGSINYIGNISCPVGVKVK